MYILLASLLVCTRIGPCSSSPPVYTAPNGVPVPIYEQCNTEIFLPEQQLNLMGIKYNDYNNPEPNLYFRSCILIEMTAAIVHM
jgi:hypothetical protein